MINNTTEVVFILDRSGSMAGLESDTIGGFNGMLNRRKRRARHILRQYCLMTDMNCSITAST